MSWLTPLAAAGPPLAVYLWTLAPTITWRHGGSDSGELVSAVVVGAVAHPPGYPLYLFLGRLAYLLFPFGDAAYRLNLFSALCMAASSALVALAARSICCSLHVRGTAAALVALTAGLGFGFAPLVWSQALIAEVYGLAMLVQAALLLALVRWSLSPRSAQGWLELSALLAGLALAAHTMLVWTVLGAFVLGVMRVRQIVGSRRASIVPLLFLLGLLPFALLPLLESRQPALSWGATDTLAGFLHHVSAADYRDHLFELTLAESLGRLPILLRTLAAQFTWPGLALALLGAWWLRHQRPELLALTLPAALGGTLFVLGYGADHPETYLLVTLPGAALWLTAGLAWLRGSFPRLPTVAFALALLLPAAQILLNWSHLNLSTDTSARDYALVQLEATPTDAVLVTERDEQTFSLWYAQRVLGVRQDVLVLDRRALGLDWYRAKLARQHPALQTAPDLATFVRLNPTVRVIVAPPAADEPDLSD